MATDDAWSVEQLTGGVSGAVYSAFDGEQRFVVKQSLEKLAVEDDWRAPRERILNEARVLRILGEIVPTQSPAVLDVDERTLTLTMEHAPRDWGDWKQELLDGRVDASLTKTVGSALGSMHTATKGSVWELPPDDGAALFFELRIRPFHLTIAERLPQYAEQVEAVARRITASRECLVHGDFSPKNILVAPPTSRDRRFWIIDDEVGHRGDPTFDLAFFLSHLALKRIRASAEVQLLFDAAASNFLDGYAGSGLAIDSSYLSQQIGCLMLARVNGRSQVGYLSQSQRSEAETIGAALLNRPDEYTPTHPLEIR
ncbi:phosphotransferase family protein [Microbacterium sp.]|uniref:phosphotransferase family protein n=1 Tax=Microbacterium sp. TaxID=51671 RepID=UPI003F72CEEE